MRVWIEGKPQLNPPAALREELYTVIGDVSPRTSPVILRMRFVFERRNAKAHVPVTRSSLPGLQRGVLDELVGVVYEDERQLVAVHATKEYGNVSGTELSW